MWPLRCFNMQGSYVEYTRVGVFEWYCFEFTTLVFWEVGHNPEGVAASLTTYALLVQCTT